MFWIGVIAFLFFFLGDTNDRFWGKRPLCVCFFAGCVLLIISMVFQIISGTAPVAAGGRVIAAAFAVICFLLLLLALFGSFSNEEGYKKPGLTRRVYTQKLYALCRHPGILIFYGLMVCLVFEGLPLAAAIVYAALNTLLALYEDRIIFPFILAGYREYQRTTRFLVPSPAGIRRCIRDFKRQA